MDWRAAEGLKKRQTTIGSDRDLMSLTGSFSGVSMGSFQQIVMGVGCLVAAFWFGSILQDRPAGQNQTAQLLPEGTIDPNQATVGSSLAAKTKGFIDSIFEPPAKEKPVTIADLRQSSTATLPDLPAMPAYGNHHHRSESIDRAAPQMSGNPVDSSIANSPVPNLYTAGKVQTEPTQQRFVGSFESASAPENLAKVAIVPDFSSLAEEVNQGLSFNTAMSNNATAAPKEMLPRPVETKVELIPVPKFSDVGVTTPAPISQPNWEEVRKQVAAAESRLKNYRQQMTQPIPEIEDSVARSTRDFWDRQASEARRRPTQRSQPTRLTASETLNASQQRRLKPETWEQKQARWDVFSNNANASPYQRETPNQSPLQQTDSRDSGHFVQSDSRAPIGQSNTRPAQPQPPRRTSATIVELDRPFVSQSNEVQRPNANVNFNRGSSARVRSLNDDRMQSETYDQPRRDQVAYNTRTSPAVVENHLRPRYNPNAGSKPEFVSPPNYQKASPQINRSRSQTSEIVEAAEVAYGNFREYTVRPQDTLQTISEKFYGSADYYFDLYLANRDQLSNPATVAAGVTIRIPKFDAR
jgi:nucleoid-associated protein YgaU